MAFGVTLGLFGLAGPAAADDGGNQRFIVIISESDGDETSQVIASGPITGVGEFEEIDENTVRFVFEEGSITLHVPTEEESEEFDEATCSGSFTFSGPWTIIEGTGIYEGATGSGTFEGTGRFFGVLGEEGCSEEGGVFFLVVHASGHAELDHEAAA